MDPLWLVLGAVALVILYLILTYNALVGESAQIDEAIGQIDVQLKRRAELIPNLVETVGGYAKHEKGVLEEVTKARTALMKASSTSQKVAADDMLTGALKSLFAVAENYPQLKANENFLQLQKELSDTEDKVAYARQYLTSQIMEYNLKVRQFPGSIIANAFGYKAKQQFTAREEEKKAVKVTF